MSEDKIKAGNYRHELDKHIFEDYVDVPADFEILGAILITQLYYNNVPLTKAKRFAKLIFNIYENWQFKMKFDYEPFNDVRFDDRKYGDPNYSEPFRTDIDSFNFTVTVNGYKPITVNINDDLNIKGFTKLMVADLPPN